MKLTFKQLLGTNEVLKRLNILRRWTSFVTEDRYNELAKQALNCITVFLLSAIAENAGAKIRWENYPKITLFRAYQKTYVFFDTPENLMEEVRKLGNIPEGAFDEVTKEIICDLTDENFSEFISEAKGSFEERVYMAATKIATYIELVENKNKCDRSEYLRNIQDIVREIERYEDIPGVKDLSDVNNPMFTLLMQLSKLRNRNRWAVQSYTTECSVLGHLYDTAIFAYFMSLEQNPIDEKTATKMFFMGIMHDIAECWTTDIPSPIKDKIPGFRKATEEFELQKLEKHIYSVLPENIVPKFKEVMFEDDANKNVKALIKGADYLSADRECWLQCLGGTRDPYFNGAIEMRKPKIYNGEVVLTPVCAELHRYFLEFTRKSII